LLVYHGTTKENFNNIEKDGFLQNPVFVTSKLEIAEEYALNNSDFGVILEFCVEDNDLEIDHDTSDFLDFTDHNYYNGSFLYQQKVYIKNCKVIFRRI